MRLIDADALLPMMKYATTDSEIGVFPIKIGFNAIEKVIEDAPTVDTVPVIRCKDCKHAEREDDGDIMCTFWDFCECNHHVLGNGYCDRAERKDE